MINAFENYVPEGQSTDAVYIREINLRVQDYVKYKFIIKKMSIRHTCTYLIKINLLIHILINKFNEEQKEEFNKWINMVDLNNFAAGIVHWTRWECASSC